MKVHVAMSILKPFKSHWNLGCLIIPVLVLTIKIALISIYSSTTSLQKFS